MCLRCVCLLGYFPRQRSVARNSLALLDESVSAVPSSLPCVVSENLSHRDIPYCQSHTVFEKCLACLGMPCEIRQDVVSCREHVVCAHLASCARSSRGRECTPEEYSCSQLLSTPLCCSRGTALHLSPGVYQTRLSSHVGTKGPWWWKPQCGKGGGAGCLTAETRDDAQCNITCTEWMWVPPKAWDDFFQFNS